MNYYLDGDFEQMDLNCKATINDKENGELRATNLWFDDDIIVRWVDKDGCESTSHLADEDPATIWEILKSIKDIIEDDETRDIEGMCYYQPSYYYDDGTNVFYGDLPATLPSNYGFESEEECVEWLENNGYDPKDFSIIEYDVEEDDNVVFIDSWGEIVDEIKAVNKI